jgi:hypothetical protein
MFEGIREGMFCEVMSYERDFPFASLLLLESTFLECNNSVDFKSFISVLLDSVSIIKKVSLFLSFPSGVFSSALLLSILWPYK